MNRTNEEKWKKIGKVALITGSVITGIALIPIAIGFGTAGIVGGSIAAAIQSIIGNVAAGSLFAVCTSLGMTGVFASTATVGAILGAGGLTVYINSKFFPEKDAKLLYETIKNEDNPDIIIMLLEVRFPEQREEIRNKYNRLYPNNNFDEDITNYVPINLRVHIENLLIKTNEIVVQTENIKLFINYTFEDYFKKEFKDCDDAKLIDKIINNKDNPLLIVRLLNYRNEEQRKKSDSKFRDMKNDKNKKMLIYIIEFMPNHPEISYLHLLLDNIK